MDVLLDAIKQLHALLFQIYMFALSSVSIYRWLRSLRRLETKKRKDVFRPVSQRELEHIRTSSSDLAQKRHSSPN